MRSDITWRRELPGTLPPATLPAGRRHSSAAQETGKQTEQSRTEAVCQLHESGESNHRGEERDLYRLVQ